MRATERARAAAVVGAGALVVGSITWALGAGAAGPTSPAQCRASAVRVGMAGSTRLEPFVADDCAGEKAALLPFTDAAPLPLTLELLAAQTQQASPNARAGVADVGVPLSRLDPRLPDIAVEVLKSRASFQCVSSQQVFSSSSRVVGLTIGGSSVVLPPGDAPFELDLSPVLKLNLNERVVGVHSRTQRALHLKGLIGVLDVDLVLSEAYVSAAPNACAPDTPSPTVSPSPSPKPVVGWMTGGGQLPGGVTHSLVLPCTTSQKHPNTKLHVETANGTFDLTTLSSVGCSMVAANGDPEQPDAAFNTLTGKGTGSCNGHDGVDASFTFTDGGEPNKGNDKASVTIDKDSTYGCHVSITGATVNGNQQAHRGSAPPS